MTLLTPKELVSAEEGRGSKFAVPEVGVGRDVGAIRDDGRGEGFRGVFISGGGGAVKRLHAVAACGLRRLEGGVCCPGWAALDWGAGFVVFFNIHVVL